MTALKIITAPTKKYADDPLFSVFIAGGITGTPPWQTELINLLRTQMKDASHPPVLWIYNPRRTNFDVKDESVQKEQIEWEYYHIRRTKIIAFWFPEETVCPIALYELGSIIHNFDKDIIVGIHPNYSRKLDLEVQTSLVRTDVDIVYSIQDLADAIQKRFS